MKNNHYDTKKKIPRKKKRNFIHLSRSKLHSVDSLIVNSINKTKIL